MKSLNQAQIVELLNLFRMGDTQSLDAIIDNFKPMVSSITRGYFLIGGDSEDLVQEGMIGLYKAIMNYKTESPATFFTFAYTCVLRQVQTAVRSSLSKNNTKYYDYLSISNQGMIVLGDDEKKGIYLVSSELNPEEFYIEKEKRLELSKVIKQQLSDFEFVVFKLYLMGYNHLDIAKQCQKDVKSISNAIARIRLKLQNFFGGENVSSIIPQV